MYKYQNTAIYPPILSDCPDYYNLNNGKCVSTGIWTINDDTKCNNIDFSGNIYRAVGTDRSSGLCAKKKWAKDCNITWDGITNNYSICQKVT
jgi:hypothetical protein